MKGVNATKFWFTCLLAKDDRNSKAKKSHPDPAKTRVTRRKLRFDCHGALEIRVFHDEPRVSIKLSHDVPHVEYTDIEIPDRWKKFIQENINSMPSKVRTIFLIWIIRLTLRGDLEKYTRHR